MNDSLSPHLQFCIAQMNIINTKIISNFYDNLSQLNYKGMCAHYHSQVRFSDPIFHALDYHEVSNMWQMLTSRAVQFHLTYGDISTYANTGYARWTATYTFSPTGRRVTNTVEAKFTFRDGLIIRHTDSFSLWNWASQALGIKGVALGWFPPIRQAIRKSANERLKTFFTPDQTRSSAEQKTAKSTNQA